MAYEQLLSEYMIDGSTPQQAETAIATDLWQYMNKIDKDVCQQYEEELKKRCAERGETYIETGRQPLEYKQEWFVDNIKTNKLDSVLWREMLDKKVLETMNQHPALSGFNQSTVVTTPLPEPTAALDAGADPTAVFTTQEQILLEECKFIDQNIENGFITPVVNPNKPVLSKRGQPFLIPIVIGVVVGGLAIAKLRIRTLWADGQKVSQLLRSQELVVEVLLLIRLNQTQPDPIPRQIDAENFVSVREIKSRSEKISGKGGWDATSVMSIVSNPWKSRIMATKSALIVFRRMVNQMKCSLENCKRWLSCLARLISIALDLALLRYMLAHYPQVLSSATGLILS